MLTRRTCRPLRSITTCWLAAGLALALATPPAFAREAEVAVMRATLLARQGRCVEALELLQGVASPTAAVARLRGDCLLDQKRYAEAVAAFEDARALDPSLEDIDLLIAIGRFHQGDFVGAEQALDAAAPSAEGRAEYHLYRGLLLLQQAEASAAAAELERARETGPGRLAPTAAYYEGLAWAAADQAGRAERAFDRVIDEAPDSIWAEEARLARTRMEGANVSSWWAWVRGGLEYDTNVNLRGAGVALPDLFSGQTDWRGVWTMSGGYEFLRNRDWSAGITGTYYGNAHDDKSSFDEHSPYVGAWVDRRFREVTTLRLRVDAGYSWIDQAPYVASQNFGPELYHDWGEPGSSKLFVTGLHRDFFHKRPQDVQGSLGGEGNPCVPPVAPGSACGPPGIDENKALDRDGWGVDAGLQHSYRVMPIRTELSAGYRYRWYDSDGTEYQFDANEVWIGSETLLPWGFELRLWGSYAHFEYDNPSVFPSSGDVVAGREYRLRSRSRRENVWRARAELEKFWTERLSTSISYYRKDRKSNVNVYDYERNISGIYVTYRFGG